MVTVNIISYDLNEINGINRVTEKLALGYKEFQSNGIYLKNIVTNSESLSCKDYHSKLGEHAQGYYKKRELITKLKSLSIYRSIAIQSIIMRRLSMKSEENAAHYLENDDTADVAIFQDILASYYYLKNKKHHSKVIVITHADTDPLEQLLLDRPEIKGSTVEKKLREKYKFIFTHAEKVVAICHSEQEYLKKMYGISAECIINGIEDATCRKEYRVDGVINVVILGSVIQRKGQDLLVKAFIKLSEAEREKVHLHIIGAGNSLSEIQEMIKNNNLEGSVTCYGSVQNVSPLLDNMHVMILPSHSDTVPIAIIEGLRASLPIFSTNKGEIPFMIDGCGGIIEDTVESVYETIIAILENPNMLLPLSIKARKRYEDMFTLDHMIDQYSNAILSL